MFFVTVLRFHSAGRLAFVRVCNCKKPQPELGFLWWAVRDLNPRPLACHEPRARSGAVADERFVPLKWTFAKVQFTSVQLDSPALLTRLLTRESLEPVGISSHCAASTA